MRLLNSDFVMGKLGRLDNAFIVHLKRFMESALYFLDRIQGRGYVPIFSDDKISLQAIQAARQIRAGNGKSAILLHGVMPRCGTGYVGELLRLHPELYVHPNDIEEVPFLEVTWAMQLVQKFFLSAYEFNVGKIGESDFLPLFGSAFLTYLYSFAPKDRCLVAVRPNVQYLNHFFTLFPNENLVLLIRDGRDVVMSASRTWKDSYFPGLCRMWSYSMDMILEFDRYYRAKTNRYMIIRYEDAVHNPRKFIEEFCQRFNLDVSLYPFEDIKKIKIIGSSTIKINNEVTWQPLEKPKDFNPVGRWRDMTERQKKIFKKIAGRSLVEAGYCADLNW